MAALEEQLHVIPLKVFQDDFRPGRGNALQAAVASIFGLELANVPNFVELPEGYESAIQCFCRDRDRASIKIKLTGEEEGNSNNSCVSEQYDGQLCVLRGKSTRGDFGHVVVARRRKIGGDDDGNDENNYTKSKTIGGFEMIHDPHPDETFLDETEKFGWCMFFVPA
jgi:hypothetical protein